ncbi:hypothetical protein Tco_0422845 [Tanacetum coccineum]
MTHPHPNRRFVPQAVLTRSGKINIAGVSVNTAIRPVNTAGSKPTVNNPRSISNAYKNGYSQVTRPFNKYSANKNSIFNKKVNTVRVKDTTARDRAVVNENKGKGVNVVKASACWGNPQQKEYKEKGVIDSDKTVYKEWEDRMVRAATTASSLNAEHDSGSGLRCQDTILGGVDAQTRFETTSKQSNDPPLLRCYTLGSGEDSIKLLELMELYTKLSDLANISTAGIAQEVEINIPSPVATKDKGKVVMQESEPPKKIKKRVQIQISIDEEQERLDYEGAVRIQEELDESERQRMSQVHQVAHCFTDAEWDAILARVATDEDLVQQLQAAKRNKPMNPAQQKAYMLTYIKNKEGGYSIKKLKSLSFEQVKEIFETTMRRVQSFVPIDYELEDKRLKRAGQEGLEEPAKIQKIGEASGSVQEQSDEEPKADELS